jgi:hypothetical protein
MLERHGIFHALSWRGSWLGNTLMQSLFALLRKEQVYGVCYRTRAAAPASMDEITLCAAA